MFFFSWPNFDKSSIDLGKIEPKRTPVLRKKITETSARISTQKFIAYTTAIMFFALITIPLVFLAAGITNITDTVELIKIIAAVLAGLVGMVWGFYFHRGD